MPSRFVVQEFAEEPRQTGADEKIPSSTTTGGRPSREFTVQHSAENGNISVKVQHNNRGLHLSLQSFRSVTNFLSDLFLPINFPDSVHDGYLQYQLYDSLQGLCSYVRGVVCSAAVLQAAGVGNSDATALGAALTWALKDGLGMIGGLGFSYMTAPVLDEYVKEFRLFADVINDVGLLLDMLAPYVPATQLLLITSCATLCKVLCGIAAGATKASITVHFVKHHNMADLQAKEQSQETLVSLMGMLLGVSLAKTLSPLPAAQAQYWQWCVFVALTIVHVWANYRGVSGLRLRQLNPPRAAVALQPLWQALPHVVIRPRKRLRIQDVQGLIVPPDDVYESLLRSCLMPLHRLLRPRLVNLNARLDQMLQQSDKAVAVLNSDTMIDRYVLTRSRKGQVQVCLLMGATRDNQIQAYVHAHRVLHLHGEPDDVIAATHQILQPYRGQWVNLLTARGWHIHEHSLHLGFGPRRYCVTEDDTDSKKDR